MKLGKLISPIAKFKPTQPLNTLQKINKVKRLRGGALQDRNRRFLQKNPLCVHCLAEGVDTPVDEWDHIVPLHKGGIDHETNIQGLCHPHHKIKSDKELKERQGKVQAPNIV